MKLALAIIGTAIFTSCSFYHSQPSNYSALEGNWKYVGLKYQDEYLYDTLYTIYPMTNGMNDEVVFGIATDSGLFEHKYSLNPSTWSIGDLQSVKMSEEIEVFRYHFTSIQAGITDYFNITKGDVIEANMHSYSKRFEVLENNDTPNLMIHNSNSEIDTFRITFIENHTKLLLSRDGYTEIFSRYEPYNSHLNP
ncbi:MAG: hypothetical protein EP346_08400 [Bacteroidetes bacterium]|nr:MAG: hypothetical protein EP346_08400 [Bacteroidota bacterium]